MGLSIIGLLLLIGVLVAVANLLERRGSAGDKRRFTAALILINLPQPLFGALLLLQPDLLAVDETAALAANSTGWILIFTGLLGLILVLPPVRRSVARVIPLDPDSTVHALALMLAGYLVGQAIGTQVAGGLDLLEASGSNAALADVVINQLFFMLLGLLGVGWLTRRGGTALAERLGIHWPTATDVGYALLWVAPLVIFQAAAGGLWAFLAPEQAAQLETVNGALLANFDTVGEWFVLAASPGIAEETLFRGALQPVFGLWISSLLFAVAHSQYAFSAGTAIVFVIGLALGHIRRQRGTTVAMIVHFGYNFALGLLSLLATQLAGGA